MRTLFISGNDTAARNIEMLLTHASYNVYRTDMGEEGIDLAKLYDYDLIFLDLGLPDMHGMEVLRQIRAARIDTPILILTGSDDTERKLRKKLAAAMAGESHIETVWGRGYVLRDPEISDNQQEDTQ